MNESAFAQMIARAPRHAPSQELWRFCLDRFRERRGQDAREHELSRVLDFENYRGARWKEGQMYVDRAQFLVRLAAFLDVDTMTLVSVACGTLNAEQAKRLVKGSRTGDGERRSEAKGSRSKDRDLVNMDIRAFAIDPKRAWSGYRGVVLLISASAQDRLELAAVLSKHTGLDALAAANFATGMIVAERYRPELAFVDLGIDGVVEMCRVLSCLTSRSRRRCRVVAGVAPLTDDVQLPATMAGAARVTSAPFGQDLFEFEVDRLEERLGRAGVQ